MAVAGTQLGLVVVAGTNQAQLVAVVDSQLVGGQGMETPVHHVNRQEQDRRAEAAAAQNKEWWSDGSELLVGKPAVALIENVVV